MILSSTAFDLVALSAYFVSTHGYQSYSLLHVSSSMLPAQRAQLAQEAINQGADWILWVDADMRFPRDGLNRLLAHKKPIVGCNYPTRKMPVRPTAFKELGGEPELVYTTPKSTGLEEVAGCGMGFLLTSTDVFKKTPKPWFAFLYSTVNDTYHGEDLFLEARAAEQGFKTFIDHDLSKQIGHTGQFTFLHDHVEAAREMEAA